MPSLLPRLALDTPLPNPRPIRLQLPPAARYNLNLLSLLRLLRQPVLRQTPQPQLWRASVEIVQKLIGVQEILTVTIETVKG